AVAWQAAANIDSLDLFHGPGGIEHAARGTFTCVEEDLRGTNPKVVVRDADGVQWTAKVGPEARPETAATRLVWAAGYFANEDYFVPNLTVRGLPVHLTRGRKWVAPGGVLRDVRMKRHLKDEKKIGNWEWSNNRFSGTRE